MDTETKKQKYLFDVVLNSIDRNYFIIDELGLGKSFYSKEDRAWVYPSPLFNGISGVYLIWLQGYGTLFIGRAKNLRYYLRKQFGYTASHSELFTMMEDAGMDNDELTQSKIVIIPLDGVGNQRKLALVLRNKLNPKLKLSTGFWFQ